MTKIHLRRCYRLRNAIQHPLSAIALAEITGKLELETWYDDMTKIPVSKMPGNLDLYSCGFPCQPYSAAGKGLGLGDERATPLHVVLQYVTCHRPKHGLVGERAEVLDGQA